MPGSGGGYNIHLMCAPEGNSEFCFPESLNVSREPQFFPETKSRETLRLEGKQNSLFPEGAHVKCFVIQQRKKNQEHLYDNCISQYHDNKSKIL